MPRSIITLTTDFGEGSPYVAQMKGVLLSLNAEANLVDITHSIPPQDVKHAARVLDEVTVRFPPDTIHVAVVDPGVGTDRRIVAAILGRQKFVAPDNGLLSLVALRAREKHFVEVINCQYWLKEVSNTFHGRDILAPVAAALSMGVELSDLGPDLADLTRLSWPEVQICENLIKGTVVSFDSFGNLITDITAEMLAEVRHLPTLEVECGPHLINELVKTYGACPTGSHVALIGSSGFLELAVVNGDAAARLGIAVGDEVCVRW
jgi:hypothetical protein